MVATSALSMPGGGGARGGGAPSCWLLAAIGWLGGEGGGSGGGEDAGCPPTSKCPLDDPLAAMGWLVRPSADLSARKLRGLVVRTENIFQSIALQDKPRLLVVRTENISPSIALQDPIQTPLGLGENLRCKQCNAESLGCSYPRSYVYPCACTCSCRGTRPPLSHPNCPDVGVHTCVCDMQYAKVFCAMSTNTCGRTCCTWHAYAYTCLQGATCFCNLPGAFKAQKLPRGLGKVRNACC